jgi:ABC-type transporter Mla MlaB component
MLRVTRIDGEDAQRILKLEGKLLEPWIPELLSVCMSTTDLDGRSLLDLSGLTYVDHAGTKVLKELIRRGYTVCGCSGFIAELLHLEIS